MENLYKKVILFTITIVLTLSATTETSFAQQFYQVPGIFGLITNEATYRKLMRKIRDPKIEDFRYRNQYIQKNKIRITAKQKDKCLILKVKNTDKYNDTGSCQIEYKTRNDQVEFFVSCEADDYSFDMNIAYKKIDLSGKRLHDATEKLETIERKARNNTTIVVKSYYNRKLDLNTMKAGNICDIGYETAEGQRILKAGKTITIIFNLEDR